MAENRRRNRHDPEFELVDTGVFDENRYFDVFAEYAKNSPNDILIRITVANRGPDTAMLHLLPTVWFRNTWTWGCQHEGCSQPGRASPLNRKTGWRWSTKRWSVIFLNLGRTREGKLRRCCSPKTRPISTRLFGVENQSRFVKDAFHEYVIRGDADAVNPGNFGTKAAPHYVLNLPPGEKQVVRLRLYAAEEAPPTIGCHQLRRSCSRCAGGRRTNFIPGPAPAN